MCMETKPTKGVLRKLETAQSEIEKLWNNGNVFAYSITSVNSQGELKTVYAGSCDPIYLFSDSHFPECLDGCFLNWKWCSFVPDTCLKKRFEVGFSFLHYCTHVSNSLSVMKTQKDDKLLFSTKSRIIYALQFKIKACIKKEGNKNTRSVRYVSSSSPEQSVPSSDTMKSATSVISSVTIIFSL